MFRKVNLILFLFFLCGQALQSQTVPAAGREGRLEIACWNLEWFGKTTPGFGPSDDARQQKTIRDVIDSARIDVWGFCEVSEKQAFDSMMLKLPAYGSVLAGYGPEQKTALIYRKDLFREAGTRLLGSAQKDSFSTRRFPLETALIPLFDCEIDTLFLIVLHLKANFGNDSQKMESWLSRKHSSEWLKMYLQEKSSRKYCMVLGDWNDDLDVSVYQGLPSPFSNLQTSGFRYRFPSRKFSDQGIGTTTSYPDAVDHQLISDGLQNLHPADSVFVWRIDRYINRYASECSDHYPVYSLYDLFSSRVAEQKQTSPRLYPNPVVSGFYIRDCGALARISMYDLHGRLVLSRPAYRGEFISTLGLPEGFYRVVVREDHSETSFKVLVSH